MNFFTALKFLTVIPAPKLGDESPEQIGRSTAYFPLVGLFIGLVLAGLNWLLGFLLPGPVVKVLVLVALVAMSGALHLDGFIDTCDGLAGHKPAEKRWEVMHDSRVGAFGVVGVILLLLVKFTVLSSLPNSVLTAALIIMPVVSRWTMVFALFAYPYALPQGLGKAVSQSVNGLVFLLATALTFGTVIGVAWLTELGHFVLVSSVIILSVWVIIVIAAAYFRRYLNGLTGDTYGAINEIAEVSVLVVVSILVFNGWLV